MGCWEPSSEGRRRPPAVWARAKCQASGGTASGVAVLGKMRVPLVFRDGASLKKKNTRATIAVKPGPSQRAASSNEQDPLLPLAGRGSTEPLPPARREQHEAVHCWTTAVVRKAASASLPAGLSLVA